MTQDRDIPKVFASFGIGSNIAEHLRVCRPQGDDHSVAR